VTGMALWLASMNTLLAAFNLIPGFPLDGGRVLRSILWWRSHNLLRSTRIASIIGRGFGYLFIFGGIALIFTEYWANGLWLLFLGWLLENAAAGSYRHMALRDILRGHKVSEVMTRDCQVVPATLTLEQLVNDHILVSGHRCYSVVDWGRSLGLVTANDIRAIERKLWPMKTVREIMTPIDKVRQVSPDDELSSVLNLLTEENVYHVPVVVDNAIVGLVWRESLLNFIHLRSELGMKF
jgi:predicted transcriptional regulator